MQSCSVFSDITKVADLRWKNAYVRRTQGAFHVIYIVFGCSLGKNKMCQVSSLYDMCDKL